MRKAPFLLACTLLLTPHLAFAQNDKTVYTDKMVHGYFDKRPEEKNAHALMAHQRTRIRELLDMFLLGDIEGISRAAAELNAAMIEIPRAVDSPTGQDVETWQAMAQIVAESEFLRKSAEEGDYKKAYGHFAMLTLRCIECHQAVRPWGTLPEPAPETEALTEPTEPTEPTKSAKPTSN